MRLDETPMLVLQSSDPLLAPTATYCASPMQYQEMSAPLA